MSTVFPISGAWWLEIGVWRQTARRTSFPKSLWVLCHGFDHEASTRGSGVCLIQSMSPKSRVKLCGTDDMTGATTERAIATLKSCAPSACTWPSILEFRPFTSCRWLLESTLRGTYTLPGRNFYTSRAKSFQEIWTPSRHCERMRKCQAGWKIVRRASSEYLGILAWHLGPSVAHSTSDMRLGT